MNPGGDASGSRVGSFNHLGFLNAVLHCLEVCILLLGNGSDLICRFSRGATNGVLIKESGLRSKILELSGSTGQQAARTAGSGAQVEPAEDRTPIRRTQ